MRHEEFTEWTAERLEAVADEIEEEDRRLGDGVVSPRASEMRVAARMVRNMAHATTRTEDTPLAELPTKPPPLEVRR